MGLVGHACKKETRSDLRAKGPRMQAALRETGLARAKISDSLAGKEARGPGRPAAVLPMSRRVVRAPAQPCSGAARDLEKQIATVAAFARRRRASAPNTA